MTRNRALLASLLTVIVAFQCTTSTTPEESSNPWRRLGPGGGGSTFKPVFSFSDPENFIVRCDMTGTYLTNDAGQSYHQVNFPNGSATYTYHPSSPGTIYLATTALFVSQDDGRSWRQLFPDPATVTDSVYSGDHASFRLVSTDTLFNAEQGRIRDIRVDPVDPETIYFTRGTSLYRSADGGNRWKRIALPRPIDFMYTNDGGLADTLLLFSEEARYALHKASGTLHEQRFPAAMTPAFSFTGGRTKEGDETVFYTLRNKTSVTPGEGFGETEIWISTNAGRQWSRTEDAVSRNKTDNLPPSYVMIAAAENDAAHAYVVTDRYQQRDDSGTPLHWYGALKTDNAGGRWQWVWKGGGGSGRYGVKDGQGVENLRDAWAEEAFGGEYIRLLEAGVYPGDGQIAVVTDWYRTMKTVDGGETWSEVYSIRQDDGSFVSRGMDVTTAYGVHFDPFDPNHLAISYTDIGYHHSFNGGETWERSVEGVPNDWVNTCYWMAFDPEVKDKLWSGWSNLHDFPRGKMTRNPRWKSRARGGVCVSTDGGRTWQPQHEGMGPDAPTTSLVLDPRSPAGNRTLYAATYNKGIFKSTDDGKTWTSKNTGLGPNTAAFELTLAANGDLYVTVAPTPAHKNGEAGTDFYSGAVYKSTDGAETWTPLQITDGPLFPNGIAVDPANPQRVYLACWADITLSDLVGSAVLRANGEDNQLLDMPGGIFLSEDGGENWTQIFDEDQYVYDVTVDPEKPGRLYCNTFNQSAWMSDDDGKTWRQLADYDFHWGHRVIPDIHDRDKVYLTTYGSSVWYGEAEEK